MLPRCYQTVSFRPLRADLDEDADDLFGFDFIRPFGSLHSGDGEHSDDPIGDSRTSDCKGEGLVDLLQTEFLLHPERFDLLREVTEAGFGTFGLELEADAGGSVYLDGLGGDEAMRLAALRGAVAGFQELDSALPLLEQRKVDPGRPGAERRTVVVQLPRNPGENNAVIAAGCHLNALLIREGAFDLALHHHRALRRRVGLTPLEPGFSLVANVHVALAPVFFGPMKSIELALDSIANGRELQTETAAGAPGPLLYGLAVVGLLCRRRDPDASRVMHQVAEGLASIGYRGWPDAVDTMIRLTERGP